MADEKDPLTLLTDTLANYIQNAAPVRRAMGLAKKNIIAFNKSRSGQQQDTNSESDVPEIAIEMAGGPSNINMASNIVSMDVTFNVTINSGDQRITAICYPVFWAVFAVLAAGIDESVLTGLKWREKTFVKRYNWTNTTAGQSNPIVNRGIKGWTAIGIVNFSLIFPKSNIAAFVQGV